MSTVFLALGSNVGDSRRYLADAISLLGQSVTITDHAPIYTSSAVGVTDQPDFFNTAIKGTTKLSPTDLLVFIKTIENKLGRIERFRWGPREIDIDIIFYDDLILESDNLTLPHPRFSEREFVLQPIADIDGAVIDPVSKQPVSALLAQLNESNKSILSVDSK